jgi:V8-like Glu-specific endopeptidase
MAKSSPRGLGGHTPVSNESEEAEARVARPTLEKAAEGPNARTVAAASAGHETVKNFKFRSGTGPSEVAAAEQAGEAPDITGLRDIGEASFGPPPPARETVHGPDDRVQITATNIYPWRVHASLLITAADNSQWIGTAWFIGPHTLATAGHCVFIKGSGVPGRDGWVRRIVVIPGRNGNAAPYGSVTSTSFRSVIGWTQNGNPEYDYGAIILPTNLGNTVGWFGFGVWPDADLRAAVGNISGYPGDKPAGTQWYDARRIASVSARKVHYDIDTFGGQSGAAVYRIISGQRYGIAIHAYGGAVTNSGTRITSAAFNNLKAWKA